MRQRSSRAIVQTLFEVGHHMAVLLAGSLAFSLGAGRATVFVALQRHPTIALVAPIVDTAEKAEQFWAIPSAARPLLRVGKSGASRSHANGLADLCSSHPAVSVRFTGTASAASLDQLVSQSPGVTLLATRKPRKGGVEALFANGSPDEPGIDDFLLNLAATAAEAAEAEAADAITYKAERAAKAARQAMRADKAESRSGNTRKLRPANSQPLRTVSPTMMAKGYKTAEDLKAAVLAYVAELPDGAVDDPALPSPLNYNELNFHGRSDLVEGCMAHGGYLKISNELGIPVRIGVERAADAKPKVANEAGKKAVNLFNMFGKAG